MAKDDTSATVGTSKKGGLLSRMQAQAAVHAAQTIKPSSVITANTPAETSQASPIVPVEPLPVATNNTAAETSLASPGVPEVVKTSEHQLPPRLSLQASSSPYVSAPYTQVPVPVTITPVDTTTLNSPSELSEIEPDEELGRPKSSALKGKRKVNGRNSEAGSSKRRSGRKKAGNNA
jgi:hypothetical protein